MRTSGLPRPPHHSVLRSPASPSRAALWRFSLPLWLAVAVSGCSGSSYRWVKDGLSTSLADAKYAACQREAELAPFAAQESEEAHTVRIRRKAELCMKADGWSLARSDGPQSHESPAGPASSSDSEPAPKRELRLAHVSEAAVAKGSDKPAEADKKVVKEVHVGGGADSGGDDEGE